MVTSLARQVLQSATKEAFATDRCHCNALYIQTDIFNVQYVLWEGLRGGLRNLRSLVWFRSMDCSGKFVLGKSKRTALTAQLPTIQGFGATEELENVYTCTVGYVSITEGGHVCIMKGLSLIVLHNSHCGRPNPNPTLTLHYCPSVKQQWKHTSSSVGPPLKEQRCSEVLIFTPLFIIIQGDIEK